MPVHAASKGSSLSTAARLFCCSLIVLCGHDNFGTLSWLGAIAVALTQDLLADNVVNLCQDPLESQLHIGRLQRGGLNEGQTLLLTETLHPSHRLRKASCAQINCSQVNQTSQCS